MKRVLILAVFMLSLVALAGDPRPSTIVTVVSPSQTGDAVVRWVDVSPYVSDGTWFMEYRVQASVDPEFGQWDTLAVIDGRKAFFFVHKYAWAEGLSYRVIAVRRLPDGGQNGR